RLWRWRDIEEWEETAASTGEIRRANPRRSNDVLLAAIRRAAEEVGTSLSAYRGWRQQDAPDELTIIRRFGSWAAAVEAAGLAVEPRRPTWTADDVLDAIRRSRATAITEYQVWQ